MIHPFEQTIKKLIVFSQFTDSEEQQAEEFFLFVEQNIKPETDYIKFLKEFNKLTGKKYIGDLKSRELYYEKEAIYSFDERIKVIKNALKDPFIKDNSSILTPKYILRPDMTAKYISYTAPVNVKSKINKNENSDYSEIQDI